MTKVYDENGTTYIKYKVRGGQPDITLDFPSDLQSFLLHFEVAWPSIHSATLVQVIIESTQS